MSRRKPSKNSSSNDKRSAIKEEKSTASQSSTVSQDDIPGDPQKKGNDPAWYARDPYLLRDVANYSFGYAWGKIYDLPVDTIYDQGSVIAGCHVNPAGVVALRTKPTLGASHTPTSALNTAAASLYAYVRHLNSGRKNYDPSDLFLYLTSIANIYSFIIFCERLYSFGMTYSDQNRYIPTQLIYACGVDKNSLIRNLANFRTWLDTFINRVSVFAVPADITYFNKVTFMYRDVFIENGDGNIKDQMYLYVPDGFYKFAYDADKMGMLDYKIWKKWPNTATLYTINDIQDFGEDLLSSIFEDEDMSLMSGDLFKVYGDRIIRLPSVDDFIALPLVYDPMVLWQMKNSTICPLIRYGNNETPDSVTGSRLNNVASLWSLGTGRTQQARPGCVFQDLNGLLISMERYVNQDGTNYVLQIPHQALIGVGKILSSELAHPGPEIVIESSRGLIGPTESPDTNLNDKGWITCGSFVVVEGFVLQYEESALERKVTSLYGIMRDSTTTVNAVIEPFVQFRYAPNFYLYQGTGTAPNVTSITSLWIGSDVNNYTIMERHNIEKLHDCALLSLFYVPGIAKI